jgi:hypothetical protein
MNPQLDFEDDLYDLFAASSLHVPDPGVPTITGRARRRTRRRRAGGASLACVALLTSGLLVANRLQPSVGRVITGTPDEATTIRPTVTNTASDETTATTIVSTSEDPFAAVTWPASTINWQRVDSTLAVSGALPRSNGGTFLALSTEPGQVTIGPDTKQLIYESSDGVTWTQRASMPGIDLGDVMTANGSLYAVGTSGGTAKLSSDGTGFGDLVIATSSDGKTWKNAALPLDIESVRAKGAKVVNVSTAIERFGDVFVAAASYQVQGPGWTPAVATRCEKAEVFKPTGGSTPVTTFATMPAATVPAEQIEGLRVDPDGTLAPACLVGSSGQQVPVSIDGLDPIIADLATHPIRLFVSKNGTDFEPVDLPAISPVVAPALSLTTDSRGFILVQQLNERVATVSRSTDGLTWTQVAELQGNVMTVGTVGGQWRALVASGAQRQVFGFSADGSLNGSGLGGPSTDPYYAANNSPNQPTIGGAGFLTLLPPGSTLVQTTNPDDFSDQFARRTRILDSADGHTYSQTVVGDLIGTDQKILGVSNVIVDKDRYIVNVLVKRADGGPPDTIVLVGRRG